MVGCAVSAWALLIHIALPLDLDPAGIVQGTVPDVQTEYALYLLSIRLLMFLRIRMETK